MGHYSWFALDDDWGFLDVGATSTTQVDRVDCFGLVGDGALDVLWGYNRHSLDHSEVRAVLVWDARLPTRSRMVSLDVSAWGRHGCRRFLYWALTTSWLTVGPLSLDHGHFRASSWALLGNRCGMVNRLGHLGLLLSWRWGLALGGLLATRIIGLRGRCGRGSLLATPK